MPGDDTIKWREWNDLRKRAEDLAADREPASEKGLADARELVHELTVHQVELELQNQELQAAQGEITLSRNAYLQLFDFAPNGYISLDKAGIVLDANLAGAEMLGIPRRHMIGRPILPYIASRDHQLFFSNLKRSFSQELEESFEMGMIARDKSPRRVRLTFQVVHSPDTEQTKCLCAMEDVTTLRENQEQLEQSLEMAQQANRAKSAFLANMSHEIRTPLNGVLGMLQVLQISSLDEQQQRYVDLALSSGGSLLELLNDLLDFSRIDAGAQKVKDEEFALGPMFEALEAIFLLQSEAKGIGFDVDVSGLPEKVCGDQGMVRQILFNLVGNAIKFTDSGSVSLCATLLPPTTRSNTQNVLIMVQDTGVGIPEDFHTDIFDDFIQAGEHAEKPTKGVGLGLAIVKRLVHLLGGTLCLESSEEGGTTFYLRLSFGSQLSANTSALDDQVLEPRTKGTVLLAEDDEINRQVLRHLLLNEGYHVEQAVNGQEALDILESHQVDCVLMDIRMPVLGGYEAIRIIRNSHKPYQNIPIIAVTAYALEEERDRLFEVGINAYVSKPVQLDLLRDMLTMYCP